KSAPGAHQKPHPRRGVGIRFPHLGQRAGSLCRVPAPQDRSRGRAAADSHGARRGLCAAGDTTLMVGFRQRGRAPLPATSSLSLRWRVMLLAMSMVAMVVVLISTV